MLAKADGVEYIDKGGSSLTVITRTKSGGELITKGSNTVTKPADFNWNSNPSNNANTNGEMRVDDDDEMLNNQEMGSPEKRNLLGKSPLLSGFTNNFLSPIGVGGNDSGLPAIFSHKKPLLDPRILLTPSALNKVTYPKLSEIEGANELMAKFDE